VGSRQLTTWAMARPTLTVTAVRNTNHTHFNNPWTVTCTMRADASLLSTLLCQLLCPLLASCTESSCKWQHAIFHFHFLSVLTAHTCTSL
jgi:hypothetical protein